MIDTHIHIDSEKFDKDRKDVIKRAIDKGVTKLYVPAMDSHTHEKSIQLEKEFYGHIFAMIGLHPFLVKPETWENELKIIKDYLDKRNFPAIGEIGIDLHIDRSTLDIQIKAFEQQIDWAIEKDLPIVIHTRDSIDEILEVLERKKHPKLRGIFHSFSEDSNYAKRIIDLNFALGINGTLTYKSSKISSYLHNIPLEHIVLETDAPFLAPIPFRGTRNESANLEIIINELMKIYDKDFEEIDRITSDNANKIFAL